MNGLGVGLGNFQKFFVHATSKFEVSISITCVQSKVNEQVQRQNVIQLPINELSYPLLKTPVNLLGVILPYQPPLPFIQK